MRVARPRDVPDEKPEPAAVEKVHRAQMQDEMRPVLQLIVEELLKREGLGPFHEPAGAGDDGDAADAAVLERNRHAGFYSAFTVVRCGFVVSA